MSSPPITPPTTPAIIVDPIAFYAVTRRRIAETVLNIEFVDDFDFESVDMTPFDREEERVRVIERYREAVELEHPGPIVTEEGEEMDREMRGIEAAIDEEVREFEEWMRRPGNMLLGAEDALLDYMIQGSSDEEDEEEMSSDERVIPEVAEEKSESLSMEELQGMSERVYECEVCMGEQKWPRQFWDCRHHNVCMNCQLRVFYGSNPCCSICRNKKLCKGPLVFAGHRELELVIPYYLEKGWMFPGNMSEAQCQHLLMVMGITNQQ